MYKGGGGGCIKGVEGVNKGGGGGCIKGEKEGRHIKLCPSHALPKKLHGVRQSCVFINHA